jgi:Xaa-Pro aminopeptidase
LGLSGATIGLELDCWHLTPGDVDRLRLALPDVRVHDASRIVTDRMDRKSPEEIEVMRAAMRDTDVAMAAFYESLRPGVTELESLEAVTSALEDVGSEIRDYTLLFGPRTALPHGYAADYRLQQGDIAVLETSGWRLGYASGLWRTAILGSDPEAERLHAVSDEATAAAIEAMRPGAAAGDVHAAARKVVEGAGRGDTMLQRAGYSIGIGWYDRGYLSLEPGAADPIEASMTFHIPRGLFDESGRFCVGTSETVLVTDTGPEVLSATPRAIKHIEA